MVHPRVAIGVVLSDEKRVTEAQVVALMVAVDETHLGAVGIQHRSLRDALDTNWHMERNRRFIVEEMTSSVRAFGVDSGRMAKPPQARIKPDRDSTWHTTTR